MAVGSREAQPGRDESARTRAKVETSKWREARSWSPDLGTEAVATISKYIYVYIYMNMCTYIWDTRIKLFVYL